MLLSIIICPQVSRCPVFFFYLPVFIMTMTHCQYWRCEIKNSIINIKNSNAFLPEIENFFISIRGAQYKRACTSLHRDFCATGVA